MSLKIERCADFPFVLGIRNGSSELMGSRNGISQPVCYQTLVIRLCDKASLVIFELSYIEMNLAPKILTSQAPLSNIWAVINFLFSKTTQMLYEYVYNSQYIITPLVVESGMGDEGGWEAATAQSAKDI